METSEAFLAARARWSGGSVPAQPPPATTSAPSPTSSVSEVDKNDVPAQPAVSSVPNSSNDVPAQPAVSSVPNSSESYQGITQLLQRIAQALEKIAELLPSAQPAQVPPAPSAQQAQVPPDPSPQQAQVPLAPAAPGAPLVHPPASEADPVIIDCEVNVIEGCASMDISNGDGDAVASKRCGVCKAPCKDDEMYALDCGHYPFCQFCIIQMSMKDPSTTYKFKCPMCQAFVLAPLKLKLDD